MGMRRIGPARWGKRNQVMGEVDEHVHEVPVPDSVGVGVAPSLHPRVVAVPALHVVAHKDPPPWRERRRRGGGGREGDGGPVEGEVEGLEVGPRF